MAYLTEDLSKQRTVIIDRVPVDITVADEPVVESISCSQDSNEHRNFQIARQLKDEKIRLIGVLSQFPVTALWLLDKYEQNLYNNNEDEANSVSDLTAVLEDIKKYYLQANLSLSRKGINDKVHIGDKQNLAIALQLFPYSFEDLTKLVDVVAYVYKYRGLCYQGLNSKPDQIAKRLNSLNGRGGLKTGKLFDLLKSTEANDCDEQFLFLSAGEMYKQFHELVAAESLWLGLRRQLAEANTRLVLFIANQYKAGFLDFDDLVQEGQTGLLKAVDRFDYRLGFQFSTYAGYWVRQAISRALSRCERVVRVPCGQVANINKVFRVKEELLQKKGSDPSVKEIAEHTKLSQDEINTILSIAQTAMSLEGSDSDAESSFAPIDFLEQQVFTHPFKTIAQSDLQNLLGKAIGILNPREAKVICSHFGVDADEEMTLQEIGAELNLTRERVRQIQVMALNKIRLNFGQQLMSFL